MKNILKKIAVMMGIIMTVSATSVVPVFADGRGFGSCDATFLGMTPWDCGVIENPSSEQELKDNTLRIIFNILSDTSVVAAYLTVGFVIWGGYKYMFSYGDAGKVAQGKKTLVNAFIGLAIVMLSRVIFDAIKFATIKGGANSVQTCYLGDPDLCVSLVNAQANTLILNTIQWVVGIGGAVAAIFVVYGGVSYMTSAGDPGKLAKAKSAIINALIGLAIVALAEIIVAFVRSMISEAETNATTTSHVETVEIITLGKGEA